MDISIIIPSFNTKELTAACIDSIDNDESSLEREVIIVDNASTDGTIENLERMKFRNVKLVLYKNDHNLGFSKACNKGIRRSSAKYILLLNSDVIVEKGAIDLMFKFAKDTPNIGVVGARLLNSDGSIQPSCFNLSTIPRVAKQYWLRKGSILDKYYPKGIEPSVVEAVVGAAFLITPECLKQVGLLNERYFMYFEDLDYCRRVNNKGLSIYYLPTARFIHYHGESGRVMADENNQWKRLIPSSKIYHGLFKHYLINAIIWSGQKFRKS